MTDKPHSADGDAVAPLPCACAASTDVQVLVKSDRSWNDKAYEQYPSGRPMLTVVRMTIPANTTLPWHTHPMPNAAYILSGQITVEERATGRKRVIVAGEAFNESVDDVQRGHTGPEPTVVIVTYAGVEGQSLSIPVDPTAHGH
jgi:quercetin dioxygenase-like cupin family protein